MHQFQTVNNQTCKSGKYTTKTQNSRWKESSDLDERMIKIEASPMLCTIGYVQSTLGKSK